MGSEYVSESQCQERRSACKELRTEECTTRDAWIGKIEKKLDNLIWLLLTQCILLLITIAGVGITFLMGKH
jgi:hypothetical protein